jgi:hypothetical protein
MANRFTVQATYNSLPDTDTTSPGRKSDLEETIEGRLHPVPDRYLRTWSGRIPEVRFVEVRRGVGTNSVAVIEVMFTDNQVPEYFVDTAKNVLREAVGTGPDTVTIGTR